MPVRGDTQPLTVTFYDVPGGTATDPTSVSLSILLDGTEVYGPFSVPPIIRDAVGRYRYEWAIPLDADLGTYTAAWAGVLPGQSSPSVGYEQVQVVSDVVTVPALPSFCWPVDTSLCAQAYNAVGANSEPVYSPAVKAYAEAMAGQSLRTLTGYRVGGCPITIRPCRQGCTPPTYRTYPVAGGGGSTPWYPVQLGGTWLNIACGSHLGACGCSRVSEIRLHTIVGAVTEVKVDGLVLDPSSYRLDGDALVRVDGETWPLCQTIDAADTEPGTWSITYIPGEPVDGIGAQAAGLLALEFAKACTDSGDCRLPPGVQTLARGGVTMTIASGLFPGGVTGIRLVDAYVARWNPHHLTGRPVVWSPDVPHGRRAGT